MTTLSKDEILRLALEAGFVGAPPFPDKYFSCDVPIIEKFATLCRADLVAENERLTDCLKRANLNHEEFERKWYLACDECDSLKAELAALRAQEPDAIVTGMTEDRSGFLHCCINTEFKPLTKLYTTPHDSAVPVVRELVEALENVTDYVHNNISTDYPTDINTSSKQFCAADAALTTAQQWLKENT